MKHTAAWDAQPLEVRLIHELTELDRRLSKRPGHNQSPYALGHYFRAAEGVTDSDSFAAAFTPTREMHGVAKRLGLHLDVSFGRWMHTGLVG